MPEAGYMVIRGFKSHHRRAVITRGGKGMEYLGAILGAGAVCFIVGYTIGRLQRYWKDGR